MIEMFIAIGKENRNTYMEGEPIEQIRVDVSPDYECVISMLTEHIEVRQRIREKSKLIELRNDINKVLEEMRDD